MPEDSLITVFNSRICKQLNGKIPIDGHEDPISIVDDKLLWKKKLRRMKWKRILRDNK